MHMADSPDSDLLNIFRDEVGEYLTIMNATLLEIETAAMTTEHLRELNRVAHSMKGAARAVGLKVIETVGHYMEEVFEAALHDHLQMSPDVCDLLYDGLDLIQNIVDGGENSQETVASVLVHLEQVVVSSVPQSNGNGRTSTNEHAPVAEEKPPETPPAPPVSQQIPAITAEIEAQANESNTLVMRTAEDSVRVSVGKLDRLMAEVSELLVARMQHDERQQDVESLRRLHGKWRREWQAVRGAYIRLARRLQDDEAGDDFRLIIKFLENNQRHLQDTNQHLSQLAQVMRQDNMRLTTLSDQLQDDISAMRMVSFETLLGTFQRIVRDVARDTNKLVHFDVMGSTVEFDKTVLDALKDPIMHLLRNAVDHGVEMPDKREKNGKSPTGRVSLSVEQRGNEIVVRIEDDGAGIDPAQIRRVAVKAGVLSQTEADLLNDDEARSLVFHPGLTTTTHVTTISGRGVGMDVVQDRVESLRGRVSVQSKIGSGTAIILNVPVSLTRIRCVVLHVGGEDYAIPSAVITRMMSMSRTEIFTAENREMIVIDERPVPLVSMGDLLGATLSERKADEIKLVVVRATDRTVAFEVDDLESERELVLKPLGPEIARAHFVSGAALLGTGQVMIVLDANDLVRTATGATLPRARSMQQKVEKAERKLRVLIADDSITTRTLEKNILETAGFKVSVAIDGAEAWRMVNEADFDVVISDVEMPNMDGLLLTREIKNNSRTKQIPVILLTSLSKPEQREAGRKAGADAYLVKSQFNQGELIRTIQSVI